MTVYVFVRKDLSPEQIVVQTAHASIEVARKNILDCMDHPHLVVIGIKNERKLEKVLAELECAGIICRGFSEPDIGNQLTAFATQPIVDDQKKIFERFCLLKL